MRTVTIILTLLIAFSATSQGVRTASTALVAEEVFTLPEPMTNCAVETYRTDKKDFVYVFGGIDSTLKSSGIHKRCYKINITEGNVSNLPEIPDSLGKIGVAATRICDKIYVVGGYQVLANGTELSSKLIHEFDLNGDTFTARKIEIPVAIDDHVQFHYNYRGSSLLYIIGGWSNTRNVGNVQIFNPATDEWSVGTPLPDTRYFSFGASGFVDFNNITIAGGAGNGTGFPTNKNIRIGAIDQRDSTKIDWSFDTTTTIHRYRAACVDGIWIGGSDSSFNYDGRSYVSGRLLDPVDSVILKSGNSWARCATTSMNCYNSKYQEYIGFEKITWPMDLRDVGTGERYLRDQFGVFSAKDYFIVGGILAGGEVSNKVIRLRKASYSSLEERQDVEVKVFPNPTESIIHIIHHEASDLLMQLYNQLGQPVKDYMIPTGVGDIDVSEFSPGVYYLR